MKRYLLIMRHSDHEEAGSGLTRARRLTSNGRAKTAAVADRLAAVLSARGDGMALLGIETAPSDEARETAEAVWQRLDLDTAPRSNIDLSTDHLDHLAQKGQLRKLTGDLLGVMPPADSEGERGHALLVVGHQPMMGWIGHQLTGTAYPLARSEVLCIEVDVSGKGRLRWALSPKDDQVVEQLREKIRSKMEIAKLLSAFISAGLGFLLSSLVDAARLEVVGDRHWAVSVSAALLFVAIGLYLATMYAYDSLLMPSRFWGEAPQNAGKRPQWIVARPPSSVQWILYQNMVRVWSKLFTPATLCVLAGLFLLAYAVMAGRMAREYRDYVFLGVGAVTALIVIAGYRGWFRRYTGPWVGSED